MVTSVLYVYPQKQWGNPKGKGWSSPNHQCSGKFFVRFIYHPKTNMNSWKKMFKEKNILFYKPSCYWLHVPFPELLLVSIIQKIVHPCYEMLLNHDFSWIILVFGRGLKIHSSQPPNHQTNQLQVALRPCFRWEGDESGQMKVLNCCQFTRCIYYQNVGQATDQLMRLKYLGDKVVRCFLRFRRVCLLFFLCSWGMLLNFLLAFASELLSSHGLQNSAE